MLRTIHLAAIATLLALPLSSTARAATIGAEVGISSIAPCPSFCGGSGATSEFTFDGGEGVGFANATQSNAQGTGQARAEFVGPDLLPRLRSLSDSQPNAQVSASATGYRAYDYAGPTTTITLDVALIGNAEVPVGNSVLDASIRAIVAMAVRADLPHSTHAPTLLSEIIPFTPGIDQCGVTFDESIPVNAGIQVVNGSVSCEVENGDRLFVWSNLTTRGTRGALASSFDSLEATFVDSTGLTAVPEPRVALLIVSAGLLAALRRR